ncbi:hypothetical protein I4U23_026852 [Adineta vaga]|nr:hypothetical protein I4U23_026852 [Adineta vaga]
MFAKLLLIVALLVALLATVSQARFFNRGFGFGGLGYGLGFGFPYYSYLYPYSLGLYGYPFYGR